jgi:hypothetical protein
MGKNEVDFEIRNERVDFVVACGVFILIAAAGVFTLVLLTGDTLMFSPEDLSIGLVSPVEGSTETSPVSFKALIKSDELECFPGNTRSCMIEGELVTEVCDNSGTWSGNFCA